MATRCTIKIEGVEYAKIYKHWDGYPEANYIWLKEFNDRFNKERGMTLVISLLNYLGLPVSMARSLD